MLTSISNRVNTLLLVLILVVVIGAVATRALGGPLDPPAPPAPTLPQAEPRSPIPPVGWDGASPISINSSGSYFLTRNLNQIPISIGADNVTFDLNGFTLSSDTTGTGISSGARNIVIRNGILKGWNVAIAVDLVGRNTFSDLKVSGSVVAGLRIGTGDVVSRVDSHDNQQYGIWVAQTPDIGGSIEDSNFSHNGTGGISLDGNNIIVRDSIADFNNLDGVHITGSWNEVTGSRLTGNNRYGTYMSGNRNVLVRNHIDGNITGPFVDVGFGNMVGPVSPATGTNPAENIGF